MNAAQPPDGARTPGQADKPSRVGVRPCRETALSFDCKGEVLQGVLTLPAHGMSIGPVGVLVVVGGPQVRVGSHRQFVALARHLASAGHAVLRFDVRGMGDSGGEARSFEALDDDIAAGIGALQHTAGVRRVALWGLCDGASASLLYAQATHDARLAGLALLNPWVRSAQSLAQTQVKHYYRARLLQPAFWAKLLRGGVGWQALRALVANVAQLTQPRHQAGPQTYQQRMALGWCSFAGSLLVLLSDDDWTAREFEDAFSRGEDWARARARQADGWHRIAGADHTLSDAVAREQMEDLTLAWLRGLA